MLFAAFVQRFPATGGDTLCWDTDDGEFKFTFKPSMESVGETIKSGDTVTRSSSKGAVEACVVAVAERVEVATEETSEVALVVPKNCRIYQLWDFQVISGSILCASIKIEQLRIFSLHTL